MSSGRKDSSAVSRDRKDSSAVQFDSVNRLIAKVAYFKGKGRSRKRPQVVKAPVSGAEFQCSNPGRAIPASVKLVM